LEKRANRKKLTGEEALLVKAGDAFLDSLSCSSGSKKYQPEKPAKPQKTSSSPLPFSSFAEGIAMLQNRFDKRGQWPVPVQQKKAKSRILASNYIHENAIPSSVDRKTISAILKMADELTKR